MWKIFAAIGSLVLGGLSCWAGMAVCSSMVHTAYQESQRPDLSVPRAIASAGWYGLFFGVIAFFTFIVLFIKCLEGHRRSVAAFLTALFVGGVPFLLFAGIKMTAAGDGGPGYGIILLGLPLLAALPFFIWSVVALPRYR